MPKVVDHDERRREIIAVVWRLIATRGISSVSMRMIAEEAGYANGVLSYYFANKAEVIRQAYEHVWLATNQRVALLMGEARGLSALRILCHEIMPRTEETLLEARIATTLWEHAMYDPVMKQVNAHCMHTWRLQIVEYLDQAVAEGEVGSRDTALAADALLTLLMGMQVMAVLTPDVFTPSRQDDMFEQWLNELRAAR
ncbi:MAG: TetR/AcrR family transcriptional regulator [Gordonia sp. (in: high G+C Gram-positive bacteria)]